jgi:two-component system NtrC family sensor kinase
MGMEDLLLDGEIDAAAQKDFLQRMRRETDRIHHVVRDLLDFARPENPSETEDDPLPAIADVRAVVDDVIALVVPQKPFRSVELGTDVDMTLRVSLHASKLTQVLLNLVLNAGAAIASAKREAGRVTIRARREVSDRIRIEVEDNGPGIAPSVRDRLFEPFVTTKPIGEGTGLGLAVCRGLIESASGEIGVDSSFDKGARFYMVLPSPKD